MSSDIFDKPNINEDSMNIFKENIKQNIQSSNYLPKQEYEDPFSKKLNTRTNVSSTTRKDNHTENRINDMMASLFPESSNRNNNSRLTKPTTTVFDNPSIYPSAVGTNNFAIFEKNKFNNNYEKLRYMLKENKLKSGKKNNK